VGRLDGQGLRYETLEAGIQFLYQLDCKHVVTAEGLRPAEGLHPIQRALVEHHASQGAYSTPGFAMALAGSFECQAGANRDARRTALTGNLCRCTGYLPILEAASALDQGTLPLLAEQYRSGTMMEDLREHAPVPVLIQSRCPSANGKAG